MADALIEQLRASPQCPPITAVVRGSWTASDEWCDRMAAAGVTVVVEQDNWLGSSCLSIGGKKLDNKDGVGARRELVAAHPQVVLMVAFSWERVYVGDGQYCNVMGGTRRRTHTLWIDACSHQRAQHVVYVSTASCQLFHWRSEGDHCIESLHYEMEVQLYDKAGGIQRWTVLRPVSLMCCRVPKYTNYELHGLVDFTTVTARIDPTTRQQLIAPSDVGRIAALVLLNSAAYHNAVLELAADCLSPNEEAEVRSAVMGTPARVDSQYWTYYSDPGPCWGCHKGESDWIVPAYAQRAVVSVEATRALLLSLLDYAGWVASKREQWHMGAPVLEPCVIA